jgi:8-oxo-dGTP diphosphatase
MRIPEDTFSYAYPHPAVTTDVVVFTIRAVACSLLLVKRANPPFQGSWALPGGFLDIDEDLDTCAARELAEETGISGVYLEQLYTFGAPDRDPRERVISVTYYALVPEQALATPRAASDAADVGWFAFDGAADIGVRPRRHHRHGAPAPGRQTRLLDDCVPVHARHLHPERTASVYETLLNQSLDKRNFRKRILSLDLIEETGKLRRNGKHRPAREYRVKHPKRVEIIK